MNKTYVFLILVNLLIIAGCNNSYKSETRKKMKEEQKFISEEIIDNVISQLTDKYKDADEVRIKEGVNRAASFWTEEDGSSETFTEFCLSNFLSTESEVESAFNKISRNLEILYGNMTKMYLDLKEPLDLDVGPISNIDMMFGSYYPASHINEDFFTNKIAFYILLNFPYYTLEEKYDHASDWTRKDWAYARMGDMFLSRVPSDILLEYNQVLTMTESYISEYNIFMGNLVNDEFKTFFPVDLKLILHWGLRDELKANYETEGGLEKQKIIYEVMKRIITQEIPREAINSAEYLWNPYKNELYNKDNTNVTFNREPDTRYQKILDVFNITRKVDPYYPDYQDYIKRNFELGMEIPQKEVEKLLIELVSSEQVKKVGKLVSKRLGRDLEPFDIWYNGFGPKKSISREKLDNMVRTKYPTNKAFEQDIPRILTDLDFSPEKAKYITSKIEVDAARGAGHAWGAEMREDKSHLRTKIEKNGMNYKGYNIAMHELGHNVEQTLSLYNIDYYLLHGVPNVGFTEALAFVFQKRDLEILGVEEENELNDHMLALDIIWTAYEIMGVSLVDMNVWKWLYEHPDATAGELKDAVIDISKDIWNKYFAEIFGSRDQIILGVYSHMISYPLYLSGYPIGQLIQFQIEKQMEGKNFGKEIERIFTQGNLIPQVWMQQAVGDKLSCRPLLEAADEALKVIN
jgi:hypothetical protein